MKGKIHFMKADGSIRIIEADKPPTGDEMRNFVGGYIELVHVLYQGKASQMIVNEEGATDFMKEYPLPINRAATEIYHNASIARGEDWPHDMSPFIHGDVILLEDVRLE